MSNIAIRVEHLSKQYRIGSPQGRFNYKRFSETAMAALTAPLRRLRALGQPARSANTFWALKDVSLEIEQGEAVGIIGANGAGKSTLLKILSRITEPTKGRVELRGRVGSLLEVGTGFHPELTGRENIYLNGAILGMKRSEIDQKFDEIVAFAEVAKFLDTPVKHYSSGMYVRLAFAVAAHLEPQILLVDEVLAVGDAAFQKKCLGKMSDVAKGGRTVVFVSHNMGSIQALCQKGIVLESGRVVHAGQIDDAVQMYLATLEDGSCTQLAQRFDDRSAPLAWYTDIYCQTPDGTRVTTALSGQSLDIVLAYRAQSDELYLDYAIAVYSSLGEKILHMATNFSHCEAVPSSRKGQVICSIPKLPLPEGTYSINASLRHGKDRLDWVRSAAVLQVQSGDYYGTGKIPPAGESKVLVDHKWTLGVRDSQS